ncbi:MAG TPA: hypothetical protein ENN42_05650 [Thioalkalivibrio sp.]|nr:hypothetical protein [Thioalkalivibrio sp.]
MEQATARPRARLAVYALAIFLSSAGLMALEIAAARLLAPYIGASLYSWTAIIGVVLGGLSVGNWLGGVWADRGADESVAGWVLGAGALACVGVLLLLTLVGGPLQRMEMGLLAASFVYVATLFFVPAVLLGVVTPLLTTLALRLDARTGHIVGMMHALAAFGSIVGTFATGYVFIQYFGTRAVILGTGAVLALLALVFLRRRMPAIAVLAVLAVGLVSWTGARGGFEALCDRETNYFCIRVVDVSRDLPFGQGRGLVLDHLLHGISHRERPRFLPSPYTHLMDEVIVAHADGIEGRPLRSFFAGGGAYTQPRALRARYPDAEIVIAEIDPAVTAVAREQMYYDGAADRIIHSDARRVLAGMPEGHFDVIVGDVFHDIAIPYHLVTAEYAELVRSRLTPDGLYVLNVVDAHPDPRLVKSIVKTLGTVFADVRVWLEAWPERPERMTYVITMGGATALSERVMARNWPAREWQDITGRLLATGTPLAELPVLTDDLAPVERLLSTLIFGTLGR